MPWSSATCIIAIALLFVSAMIWANEPKDEIAHEITSVHDTLMLNDSIVVIHTICAPICSSYARVYNKEWQEIGRIKPTFTSAFPEAYIEDGKILWRDNDTLDYNPTN